MIGASFGRMQRAAWLAISVPALLAISAAAQAQSVSFIRANGNDANPCTLASPCDTLQRGINAAPAGGEVRVLDSGSFGPTATVAKSLTISGKGATVILTGALIVNHPAAKVVVRDLLFNGRGSTQQGIVIADAASVHIVRCEIERFVDDGIALGGTSAGTELFVTDSISRNNGDEGLSVAGNGATRVTLDNSRFENNGGAGLNVAGAGTSITRSTFSGNDGDGVFAQRGATNVTWTTAANNVGNGYFLFGGVMQLKSSVARGNSAAGIRAENSPTPGSPTEARISNVTATDNNVGIQNQAIVRTRQNNLVSGNTTDTAGNALTPLGPI